MASWPGSRVRIRLAWIGNVGRRVGSMGPLRVRITLFYFGCGSVCLIAFCWGGGFDTDVIGGRGRVEGCVIRIDCWDGSEGRGCGPSSDGDCDRGCSHDIDFCAVQLGLLA